MLLQLFNCYSQTDQKSKHHILSNIVIFIQTQLLYNANQLNSVEILTVSVDK